MYTFKIKKEAFHHPEIGLYYSYSIEVYKENHHKRLGYVPDVFTDLKKAQEFADVLNQCQPEPVHLEELCISFIQ